jgi:hypothetical protein
MTHMFQSDDDDTDGLLTQPQQPIKQEYDGDDGVGHDLGGAANGEDDVALEDEEDDDVSSLDDDDNGLKPTTTGGKGLWNLWTRNFKSTLLMLLDLVDNSVDAIMQKRDDNTAFDDSLLFVGQIEIYRDIYDFDGDASSGLCIRNNSPKAITPLKDVLNLFISTKDELGAESIGENGVGLKQSCAALSELCFVLVKNGSSKLELGILSKSLQKVDGCL